MLTNAARLTRKQNEKLRKIALQLFDSYGDLWTPFGDQLPSKAGILRIPSQSYVIFHNKYIFLYKYICINIYIFIIQNTKHKNIHTYAHTHIYTPFGFLSSLVVHTTD